MAMETDLGMAAGVVINVSRRMKAKNQHTRSGRDHSQGVWLQGDPHARRRVITCSQKKYMVCCWLHECDDD
jgi:hypothetical protein